MERMMNNLHIDNDVCSDEDRAKSFTRQVVTAMLDVVAAGHELNRGRDDDPDVWAALDDALARFRLEVTKRR